MFMIDLQIEIVIEMKSGVVYQIINHCLFNAKVNFKFEGFLETVS